MRIHDNRDNVVCHPASPIDKWTSFVSPDALDTNSREPSRIRLPPRALIGYNCGAIVTVRPSVRKILEQQK
jgi:hypothetical protein